MTSHQHPLTSWYVWLNIRVRVTGQFIISQDRNGLMGCMVGVMTVIRELFGERGGGCDL